MAASNLPAGIRSINGRRVVVTGADTSFFGSMQPLPPMAQAQTMGRQFDYPFAVNLYRQPKQLEGLGFTDLRALSDNCTLVRLAIETRKDQLEAQTWSIKPRDAKKKPDRRCKKMEDFFQSPDKERAWGRWLRELVEDLLVIDAPTLYARRTMGGDIYSFEIIDGGTVKRLLNADGRTPQAPDPAYQQIIKGMPTADYTTDEMVYFPRNTRSHKIYGFSPVEQLLTIINIATRRDTHKLNFYTKGTIPDGFLTAPDNWNLDQVEKFQTYLNDMLSGDLEARRQMLVLPSGLKFEATKAELLKDMMDEWLARVICYCFSLNPQAFCQQVNRATSEVAQNSSLMEGLAPLKLWVKQLVDFLLTRHFLAPDLEFVWEDEQQTDPLMQAQTDQIYLNANVKQENEVRDQLGLDPLDDATLAGMRAAKQPKQPDLFGKDGQDNPDGTPPDGKPPKSGKGKGGKVAPKVGTSPKNTGNDGQKADKTPELKKKASFMDIFPIKRDTDTATNATVKIGAIFTKAFKKAKAHTVVAISTKYANAHVQKADGVDDAADRILGDLTFSDFDGLPKKIEGQLKTVAAEGQTLAFNQIGVTAGIDLNLMNGLAQGYAATRSAELVSGIADATRNFLRSVVVDAIESGMSTTQLANAISENQAFSDARAERIARTEIAFAQVNGNMQAYRESGVVTKKKWATGAECCEICAMNEDEGEIPLDDPFQSGDDAPPAHPNCFVAGTGVSALGVTKAYKRWFEGEVVTIGIAGGNKVTVTPNHPILTARGWIPAGDIQIADRLAQYVGKEKLSSFVDPKNNYVESRIEDVACSLGMACGVSSATVKISAKDFHGDGIADQKVDVVTVTGELAHKGETVFSQEIGHNSLSVGHGGRVLLATRGTLANFVNSDLSPPDSIMGGGDPSGADIGGGSLGLSNQCVALASNLKAESLESVAERAAMASDAFANIDAAFARQISFVQITDLGRGEFRGHVYNLETVDGWYLAESLIVSNCRCDVIPVVPTMDAPDDGTEE